MIKYIYPELSKKEMSSLYECSTFYKWKHDNCVTKIREPLGSSNCLIADSLGCLSQINPAQTKR